MYDPQHLTTLQASTACYMDIALLFTQMLRLLLFDSTGSRSLVSHLGTAAGGSSDSEGNVEQL
jgi:hypothetical protein